MKKGKKNPNILLCRKGGEKEPEKVNKQNKEKKKKKPLRATQKEISPLWEEKP